LRGTRKLLSEYADHVSPRKGKTMRKGNVSPTEQARVRRQIQALDGDVKFVWDNFQRMKAQLPGRLSRDPVVIGRMQELSSHIFEAKKQALLLQAVLEKLMPTRQERKKGKVNPYDIDRGLERPRGH